MLKSKLVNILVIDDKVTYLLNDLNYPVGGASVQTYSWVHGLSKLSNLTILSRYTSKGNKESTDYDIVYQKKTLLGSLLLFRIIRNLFLIKKVNPDIIYVSTAGINTFMFAIISQILKIKYVQRISNDISYVKDKYIKRIGWAKYCLSKIGIKYADFILCQNELQVRNLEKVVDKRKIHLILNPFYYVKEIGIKKDKNRYIAWVGIFKKDKNLKALYDIAESLPEIMFKIAGKEIYNVDDETKVYVNKLKGLSNVIFVGLLSRKEIPNFLYNAKCLLNTSHHEGFSNTYLEAFSVGCPIVTRKKTDPSNIIENNFLGITTTTYKEIPAILRTIDTLIDRRVLIGKSQFYLDLNHNPSIIAKKFMRLVQNENS